jgi:hypothetical protein
MQAEELQMGYGAEWEGLTELSYALHSLKLHQELHFQGW